MSGGPGPSADRSGQFSGDGQDLLAAVLGEGEVTRAHTGRGLERANDLRTSLAPAQETDTVGPQVGDGEVSAIQPGHLVGVRPFLTVRQRAGEGAVLAQIQDVTNHRPGQVRQIHELNLAGGVVGDRHESTGGIDGTVTGRLAFQLDGSDNLELASGVDEPQGVVTFAEHGDHVVQRCRPGRVPELAATDDLGVDPVGIIGQLPRGDTSDRDIGGAMAGKNWGDSHDWQPTHDEPSTRPHDAGRGLSTSNDIQCHVVVHRTENDGGFRGLGRQLKM